MLHGYGSKKESFYYQINYLKEGFSVTAPDFPCFGASECTDTPFSVGDYADWLLKFIEKCNLKKPSVIAHSFGARVALKLVSKNGELFDKLIITGGAGIVKPRSSAYIRRVKAYRSVKKLFPKFAERHFGSEEYRKLSPLMRESYKLIVNEDLSSCAKKITNKTLLLYGEKDTVTPLLEEGQIFNSLIVNSTLKTMPGGHFCFSEYPDLFNKEIYNFLSE